MPGPLPTENPRRRNAPTLPTDALPLTGTDVEPPEPIEPLSELEQRYFDWAWSTPAASAWHSSDAEVVAEWARLKVYASRGLGGKLTKFVNGVEVAVDPSSAILAQITSREDRLLLSPMARKKGRAKIIDGPASPATVATADNVVTPERWKRTAS